MPPRAWSTYHFSIVLLTEFVNQLPGATAAIAALDGQLDGILSGANLANEKANLLEAIEFRPGVMAEALSQKDSFTSHFRGALSYSKGTHPNTVFLEQAALRVAQFAAMYYKNRYQRPRPSQLWPELMPPITVPGHAAFPSGHATEAFMLAALLTEVATAVVPSAAEITTRLAQRIARNREVLGLHYPTDQVAGIRVATATYAIFRSCPTVAKLIGNAQTEWTQFTT